MSNNVNQRELFGKKTKPRRPNFESKLEKLDKQKLPERASRIRWLNEVMPQNSLYVMPTETYFVFEEAKSSFVYGCFVSTIVLCAAFVEHWMSSNLNELGYSNYAKKGLFSMIACSRKNKLVNDVLLNRIDELRKIRNPFIHLKNYEHEFSLGQRVLNNKSSPQSVLEEDAKESLITIYSFARYAFKNT